jgi:hypothetical protein
MNISVLLMFLVLVDVTGNMTLGGDLTQYGTINISGAVKCFWSC